MIYVFVFFSIYHFSMDETAYTGLPGKNDFWTEVNSWNFQSSDSSFSIRDFYFKTDFTPSLKNVFGYNIVLNMEFFRLPDFSKPRVYKTISELSLFYKRNLYRKNELWVSGKIEVLLPLGTLIPVHTMLYLDDKETFFKYGEALHLLFLYWNKYFVFNSDFDIKVLKKMVSKDGYLIYPEARCELSLLNNFFLSPVLSGGYQYNKPVFALGGALRPFRNIDFKITSFYYFFAANYYDVRSLSFGLTAIF